MVQPIFFSNNLYQRYASLISIEKVNGRHAFPAEDGEICLGDEGYAWLTFLPDKCNWCMTAMYDDRGNAVEWYFDMTKANGLDEQGNPYQEDLYLDVVLLPNGSIKKLDEDELQEALDDGEITKPEFDMAHAVCDGLIREFICVPNAVASFCERCFAALREPAVGREE